jgi:DNA polymerase III subunit epsilon
MDFISLDFETANFKRSSACAIGIAVFENGLLKEAFSELIKPNPNYFEPINVSIHGITSEMVKNKPIFSDKWNDIKHYFTNQNIVAHNASFDFSVLRSLLDVYDIPYPSLNYYCSLLLAKKSINGLLNYQLPTICRHFNISLNHHDAGSDAVASGLLTIELCKIHNVNSLPELMTALNFQPGKFLPNDYKPFKYLVSKSSHKTNLFEITPQSTDFDEEHPFYNKCVVFTGALSALPRVDAQQIVVNAGGKIKDGVTKDTNYLVVGNYDFNRFGQGFKSSKLQRAEGLINEGFDLEIISENDFFGMVHYEQSSFEIKIDLIKEHSMILLQRNKYNDFSHKNVYFSSDLSIERTKAFQMVGNCSGFGHDYDNDVIAESDYFVISDKLIEQLKNGIKAKSIMDFEKLISKAKMNGTARNTLLIDESTFFEYMKRREQFQKGEIHMHIYEWEVNKK